MIEVNILLQKLDDALDKVAHQKEQRVFSSRSFQK